MTACPCGSGSTYEECCLPLIRGERPASSPEQLMRSRYSAYVQREIPYLRASLHPDHRKDYDDKSSRQWAESAEWHGLEIRETSGGGPDDDEGEVEFVAAFTMGGQRQEHHERSQFARLGGAWYFVSGKEVRPQPVVRAAPKVGRNDPCPCGSGKKHKKCCGGG